MIFILALLAITDLQPIVQELKDGPTLRLAIDGTLRRGNSVSLDVGAKALAGYRTGDHLGLAVVSARRVSEDARGFGHLRYVYWPHPVFAIEAFAQYGFDESRRLASRALTGAGPRLTLVDTDDVSIALGIAYMLELERIDDGGRTLTHRASAYLLAVLKLGPATLTSTSYAQPRIGDVGDTRAVSKSAVSVDANAYVSIRAGLVFAFDSRPPPGVEALDTTATVALVFSMPAKTEAR